jgi:hypothetical protein
MENIHYPTPYLLYTADAIVSDACLPKAAKHNRTLAA